MESQYRMVSLDGPWTIEGMDLESGLAKEAYNKKYVPVEPVTANVPCIVQAALLEAGKIEDPYWEMNNEKILWIEEKEWWFFKKITIPSDFKGKRYELVFEGITYRAEAWLDGINIGHFEGMFSRNVVDISKKVKPGQTVQLTLRLRAHENTSEDRPGGKIKRGTVRSSGVVAPFSYWWNWSPHMVPIGIWKSVWLKITGGITMHDTHVRTAINWDECEEAKTANLNVAFELKSTRNEPEQIKIKGYVTGDGFQDEEIEFRKMLEIQPGQTLTEGISLVMNRPRLWWPNPIGDHPIYKLHLDLYDSEGILCDTVDTEFGVREVSFALNDDGNWVQETSRQSNRMWSIVGNPYPWTFVINRKKIFIRGTNWLPIDNLFRFSEERYRLFIDQIEDSSLNLVRVWAGGIMETETFYKLCNRKGIMCWSEFWLSCAVYPAMPQDLFIENAVEQVKVLRNHPAIVMWSGGNEYNPDALENKDLVDGLQNVIDTFDPDRRFRRGSPYKGDRHGGLLMMPTRTSNKYNGDILNGHARLTLFRAEIAVMRSAPVLESIKKFIGEDKIWPINKESWQYHHAVIREQERDAKEYGGTDGLEYWLMSGQIAHGQVHRHNMEYCRSTKWWQTGCMQWQINGSWPSMHRELIDWYGVPKPAYFMYKRSSQDYLVTVDMEKYMFDGNETFSIPVFVVSEKLRYTGDVQVDVWVYDRDMKPWAHQTETVELKENTSVRAYNITAKVPAGYQNKVFFFYSEMRLNGKLLANNLQWAGTTGYTRKEKDLCLNGPWNFQVIADNLDKPHSELLEDKWGECNMPAYWAFPQRAPDKGKMVFFRRKIVVPADFKGKKLELFSAGFEGNDQVYINGKLVGQTKEEMTVTMGTDDLLFTEKWAERQAQEKGAGEKKKSDVKKTDNQNVRVNSDPYVVPNLIKRFYEIPEGLLNFGGKNVIEVVLYGEHATGISEPVYIREVSSAAEQKEIRELDNRGDYLADMRKIAPVKLDGALFCSENVGKKGAYNMVTLTARIENNTDKLAFFTELKLEGLPEGFKLLYEDNYGFFMPGEDRDIKIKLVNVKGDAAKFKVKLAVGGWNVEKAKIGKEVEIRFE